ncbi:MAG TPA: PQQ-dependent sugar dehydrogenase [Actinomycetes bacterium]|nr:PQQ-dependent sugar dehydrogenase [Actinomycetes bacterium]
MATILRTRSRRRTTLTTLAAALALLLGACDRGAPDSQSAPAGTQAPVSPAPPTAGAADGAPRTASQRDFDRAVATVKLEQVAQLDQPLAMAAPKGDDALYVAEQAGRVRLLRDGQLQAAPVLDVSDEVHAGGEQGLLGIAVSPDRRYLYVNLTNRDQNTSVREYRLHGDQADRGSMRELLQIEDFAPNHNGGELVFGPDGELYTGAGDGGGAGDPHENGQKLDTLLGKILRISPRPDGDRPYGIPADNPFVGRAGARPEIWAYGLRNPWRFSIDPATGDMWIGDVGQNAWEEISVLPGGSGGGQNFGWDDREGGHEFEGDKPPGAIDPVLEYGHGDGCTVIGGEVYRGRAIPGLQGAYLYGDYCTGWIRAVRTVGGRPDGPDRQLELVVPDLSSFGVDQQGELYALSLTGGVYRLVSTQA